MKSKRRVWLRVIGLTGVVVILIPVVCLDTVDYQPFLRSDYFNEATARVERNIATNAPVVAELKAGFAAALLSPSLGASSNDFSRGAFRQLPLAGYGARRGRSATGVHDDLYVKVVAIQVGPRVALMVGADLLIIPREVADLATATIERELHLAREQVYLGASHTHCSLGGWGEGKVAEGFAGPFQPEVRAWIADRIVTATRLALNDLKPAALGHGRFSAPDSVRNRLIGRSGRTDPEFSFLILRQEGGRTGVLGSFGAHATVLGSRVMEFSGDYPGYWQRAVEAATGGVAIFLAGPVGSQSPSAGEGPSGFEAAQRLGTKLADLLIKELPKVQLTNVVTFHSAAVELTLPQLQVRLTDQIRLRPWLASRVMPVHPTTFVQVFRLNGAIWISTPCDYSAELSLDLKDYARARGYDAAVTSFNGDYIGYIIPSHYYHLGGYEPQLMSFYGPQMPDYLNEVIRKLCPPN